jgi:hypothetical protein
MGEISWRCLEQAQGRPGPHTPYPRGASFDGSIDALELLGGDTKTSLPQREETLGAIVPSVRCSTE